MKLPPGIETRTDSQGVVRYRAHAKQGRRKLRGPWTPNVSEAVDNRTSLLGVTRAEREASVEDAGLLYAGAPRPGVSGVVYFIRSGGGPIKVGHTRGDVSNRMAQMQCEHYEPLHLLATEPGTKGKEHELHERFAAHRIRGEWFEAQPVLEYLSVGHPWDPGTPE